MSIKNMARMEMPLNWTMKWRPPEMTKARRKGRENTSFNFSFNPSSFRSVFLVFYHVEPF